VLEVDGEGESMDKRFEAEEGLVAVGRSLKALRETVVESCLTPAKAGVGILRGIAALCGSRQHSGAYVVVMVSIHWTLSDARPVVNF
jgi:hypothetical protein